MAKPKKKPIILRVGEDINHEANTAGEILSALDNILAQLIQTIELVAPDGTTQKLTATDIKYWAPGARTPLKSKVLTDFLKYKQSLDYAPHAFRGVFNRLCQIETSESEYHVATGYSDSEMDKLIQSGFLTSTVKILTKTNNRARSYRFLSLTEKARKLIQTTKDLPAKSINPDGDFWYAMAGYVTGSASVEHGRLTYGEKYPKMLACMLLVGAFVAEKPTNTKLEPLYALRRGAQAPYFSPKYEEAFLKKLTKTVKSQVFPRWTRNKDYKIKERTLDPPRQIDYVLIKLVSSKDHCILLGSDNASYLKMLLDDNFKTHTEPTRY